MAMDTLTPPATETTFDPPLAQDILDGLFELVDDDDDSFVRELFESFVQTFDQTHGGMRRALDEGNPEDLHRYAHTLKGASSNLGALPLAELAKELQRMGEEGQLDGAAPWVEACEKEYGRVMQAVREMLPGFTA